MNKSTLYLCGAILGLIISPFMFKAIDNTIAPPHVPVSTVNSVTVDTTTTTDQHVLYDRYTTALGAYMTCVHHYPPRYTAADYDYICSTEYEETINTCTPVYMGSRDTCISSMRATQNTWAAKNTAELYKKSSR